MRYTTFKFCFDDVVNVPILPTKEMVTHLLQQFSVTQNNKCIVPKIFSKGNYLELVVNQLLDRDRREGIMVGILAYLREASHKQPLFEVSQADYALLASKEPLSFMAMETRLMHNEDVVQRLCDKMENAHIVKKNVLYTPNYEEKGYFYSLLKKSIEQFREDCAYIETDTMPILDSIKIFSFNQSSPCFVKHNTIGAFSAQCNILFKWFANPKGELYVGGLNSLGSGKVLQINDQ